MIISEGYHYFTGTHAGEGYFAGEADGIVTVGDDEIPASRQISVFDAQTFKLIRSEWSLGNGRFLIKELATDKQFLLVARDYKKQYQPEAWDYRVPHVGLTPSELEQLWASWQQ